MPLLLLLLLLLVTLQEDWPNPLELDPPTSTLIAAMGVATLTCAAELIGIAARRTLRRDPGRVGAVLRRFAAWKRWHQRGLLAWLLLALYVFGWGAAVRHYDATWRIPGFRAVMLTPLLAGLVLGWLRHYDVELLGHEILQYPWVTRYLSRWAYLDVHARHNFLFILPPLLLLVVHESVTLVLPDLRESENALLLTLFGIALLAFGLIAIPLMLRVFLGLRPLGDGPLRQRLFATARRLRFRFNDVLVWDTRNGVANAMVTGVIPWLRYVVITDRLLDQLNDEEIEAVFGHEVGHMKHHHMSFYMVFILTSLMLLSGLWHAGSWWLQQIAWPGGLDWLATGSVGGTVGVWLIVAVVALYVLVVFGWLSRRCERQADIHGCKTASPAAFISALEKVADLNGIPRENPGFFAWWQHSTIADRVGFIRRMEVDPDLAPRFQRRLGVTKWSLAIGMICLVALLGSVWGWGFTRVLL